MVKEPSLPGCAKAIVEINKVKAKKKDLLSINVFERNRGNNFINVTDFIIFFYCNMTTKKNSIAKVLVPYGIFYNNVLRSLNYVPNKP
jgi:hypothetical protein